MREHFQDSSLYSVPQGLPEIPHLIITIQGGVAHARFVSLRRCCMSRHVKNRASEYTRAVSATALSFCIPLRILAYILSDMIRNYYIAVALFTVIAIAGYCWIRYTAPIITPMPENTIDTSNTADGNLRKIPTRPEFMITTLTFSPEGKVILGVMNVGAPVESAMKMKLVITGEKMATNDGVSLGYASGTFSENLYEGTLVPPQELHTEVLYTVELSESISRGDIKLLTAYVSGEGVATNAFSTSF